MIILKSDFDELERRVAKIEQMVHCLQIDCYYRSDYFSWDSDLSDPARAVPLKSVLSQLVEQSGLKVTIRPGSGAYAVLDQK